MTTETNNLLDEILKKIAEGRKRTNLLRGIEQRLLAFFVTLIPQWISPNVLTFVGFLGAILVSISFFLASIYDEVCLIIGVVGLAINWFGDSLDGRLAYYRNRPRRWYGFVLDITVDFVGIVLIGLGFIFYAEEFIEIFGYLFVTLYAWEFIIILMRFKITGDYSIDSGIFGPTEVRIVISLILILEIFVKNSIAFFAGFACLGLVLANILDTNKLLKLANAKDEEGKVQS